MKPEIQEKVRQYFSAMSIYKDPEKKKEHGTLTEMEISYSLRNVSIKKKG